MTKFITDKYGFRRPKLTITETILQMLAGLVDFVADTAISRKKFYAVLDTPAVRKESKSDINNWVSSLRQSGYIKYGDSDGQKSIILTNKAKLKIVESYSRKRVRDNKYRFISFDIPEDIRIARNKFRHLIKRIGFVQIQKSLWVIDRDVTDIIEMAAYEYGVEKYIVYIISEKSDIDGLIKKKLHPDNKTK